MTRARSAGICIGVILLGWGCRAAWGQAYEVRLLQPTEKDGMWGTDELQVSVPSSGLMRHVSVRGTELIWQAAAIYTAPRPPNSGPGIRTVQGEGYGGRGLSVHPPTMQTHVDRGRRTFSFRHLVSSRKVLEGQPLCQVDQNIVPTPTGQILINSDCHWTENTHCLVRSAPTSDGAFISSTGWIGIQGTKREYLIPRPAARVAAVGDTRKQLG